MENSLTTADTTTDLIMNPTLFEQLQRGAKLFASSGLVPAQFKENPAACFVGLQLAQQLGVNPFMLFQRMYSPGGGKIAVEAQVMIAVANQRGVFTGPIEYEFTGKKGGDDWTCTARATLSRSNKQVDLPISWATVKGEGWSPKNPKWTTMPEQMFRYRTATWLIRTYCPEVIMGLSSVDEIEDIHTATNVTPQKTSTTMDAIKAKLDIEDASVVDSADQPAADQSDPFAALTPQQIAQAKGRLGIKTINKDLTDEQKVQIVKEATNA